MGTRIKTHITPKMRIISFVLAFVMVFVGLPYVGGNMEVKAEATGPNIYSDTKYSSIMGTSGYIDSTENNGYHYTGKITKAKVTMFDYVSDNEIGSGNSYNNCWQNEQGYQDVYTGFNSLISTFSPSFDNSLTSNSITVTYKSEYFASSDSVKAHIWRGSNEFNDILMTYDSTTGKFTCTFTPGNGICYPQAILFYKGDISGSDKTSDYNINMQTNHKYEFADRTQFTYYDTESKDPHGGLIYLWADGKASKSTNIYWKQDVSGGKWYAPHGSDHRRWYWTESWLPTKFKVQDASNNWNTGDKNFNGSIKRGWTNVFDKDGDLTNSYFPAYLEADIDYSKYTNPLYFGCFWMDNEPSGYLKSNTPSYNNFWWQANMGFKPYDTDNRGNASVQGLVNPVLSGGAAGKLMDVRSTDSNPVELPYFSKTFNSTYIKYYDKDNTGDNINFPFYESYIAANSDYVLKSVSGSNVADEKAKFYQFCSKDSNLKFNISDVSNHKGYFTETTEPIKHGAEQDFLPFNANDNHNTDNGKDYNNHNLGFGAKFETTFKLQRDGCVGATKLEDGSLVDVDSDTRIHTIFEFTGDDDLWVFIDGNLVLDMGGAHLESNGIIDFATKIATAHRARTLGDGVSLQDLNLDYQEKSIDFTSLLKPGSFYTDTETSNTYYNPNVSHTLTVFYMERGMLDSNLLIRFNYSPEANFSKMKITEVTDFDNINEGLKNATMKAAEDDVFMYTVTNTNTSSEDVKTNSARFPVAAQSIRTNQSVTTQLTPGTGSPGTASIDFVPGAQDVPTAVANTSYLWVDEFADNSKIVGKSNGSGQLYLMYGTCKNLYPSAEETKVGKESSAEFEKQFTRNSTMAVLQSDTLYKPNRASSPGLFGDSNLVTGNQLSSVPTATRSVSAYYTTTKIVKDRDKNTIPFIDASNGTFTFNNDARVDAGSSVMLTEYFINTVKTGNLQITKNVSGNAPANANYSFTLTLSDVFGVSGVSVDDYTGITYTKSNPAESGTLGAEGTFSLQAGQSITITGIPYGTKYTVTETGGRAPTVRGEVTDPTALTSADGTVTVEVTNEYPTKVTVKKITTNEGDPSGAELDLYYKEKTIPPAYIFNDPFVTPTKQITVTIPTKPTAPAVQPVEVTNTTKKKTYSYKYETENTPSVTPTSWILPRSDNDYIYFRDYNSGSPADHDAQSFTGGQDTTGSQNAKRSWLYTDFSTNVETQNHELNYTHNYWFEAQFSGPGKADVKYSIWERFVDRYNSNGKEQDTVVWKIQPPDGYNEVRFCMYDGGHCIRTTEKIKFRLGEIYEKTDWGGIYKNEGVDCYFNVPLNDEQHNNWATHRTTGAGDPDKRMTNFDSTNGASTMQQAERYVPTEQKVIFHCNSNQVWHNIHIEFFKNTGTDQNPNYVSVGQQFPGYMMEPYAYAGDNYRIGNYLTYELTIPDGATHFRVNNGVALNGTSPYRYSSDYTKLYDATDKNGKKNYANYFKIQGAAGTTAGVNVTSGTAVTLDDWTDYPSADERNKNYNANEVESDYDYVYFEAPNSWGSHIYAYFYGGGDLRGDNWQRAVYSIWPGITPVGTEFTAGTNSGSSGHSDIYDYPLSGSIANPDNTFADKNNSTTVYKFKIPLGERKNYSKVIFNNGLKSQIGSNTLEETGVIDYNRGYLYKANGSSYQHYENKPTNQFEQRGDKLYIRTGESSWDDIHIKFYNASGTQILQGGKGYLMQYSGVRGGYTYYTIPIPTDAKKFSLNNGKSDYSSSTGTNNDFSTGIYDIPGYDPDLVTTNVITADVTKKDVVYKLTNTSLEQTSPKITLEEEVVNETTGTTFTPENPSPRGDHLYIRDAGNILSDIPTIKFYEFADSSTAISTSLAAVKLEDSPEGTDWYSIGIPVNASYFTMTYNNGTSDVTTDKTPIYAKSTGANQLNATPGDMYYDTTADGLEITWPTFTSDADDLTDERYTDTSPYGQRGDNLYVVSGSALSNPKVIFYNSSGVPIVNAAGNSEISLKSLGQITAPASGAAPIDGKTSNDTNAQGYWYRAAIPTDAATFVVKYGSTTTEQEKIYEKSSKIKRYSNDYTLDGMQYRINGTSATLLYPIFEEDPNYTLDAGGGQVINSNGSTVRVDTTKVSDYANYGAATAEKVTNDPTPALYQTDTNNITYTSGSEYYDYIRFDVGSLGWTSVKAYFYNSSSDNTGWDNGVMTKIVGTNVFKYSIPTTSSRSDHYYQNVIFHNADASGDTNETIKIDLDLCGNHGHGYKFVYDSGNNESSSSSSKKGVNISEPAGASITKSEDSQLVDQNRVYFYQPSGNVQYNNTGYGFQGDTAVHINGSSSGHKQDGTISKDSLYLSNGNKLSTVCNSGNLWYFDVSGSITSVYFKDPNNYVQTQSLSGTNWMGHVFMVGNTNDNSNTLDNKGYTYNSIPIHDIGKVQYGTTAVTYTYTGCVDPGSGSTMTYQPEDRYGMISEANSTTPATMGDSDANNYIYISTSLSDPYIMFYDSSNAAIGGSGMETNGISLKKAKINGDTTTTDNTSPYKIRLPKNAASFRIANGANGTQSEAFALTGSVRIKSADRSYYPSGDEPSMTITDYHHAGTTFSASTDSTPVVTISSLRTGFTAPKHDMTQPLHPRSDIDYVYFTDTSNTWGDTVYAYFYGGEDGEYTAWPGVKASTSDKAPLVYTNTAGHKVFMFQLPKVSDGKYPYVIFNNGSGNNRKETQAIRIMDNDETAYTAGGKNYSLDANSTQQYGTSDSTNVLAYATTGTPKTSDATVNYSSSKYIYIINNGTKKFDSSANRDTLDDLHIVFYDSNNNVVGTSGGYKPDKLVNGGSVVKYEGSDVYRIAVPANAAKFQITNGDSDHQVVRQSEIKPVAANGLYRFVPQADNAADYIEESSVPADIKNAHFLLDLVNKIENDDEDTPEIQTYDVKLATVVTGADGSVETIKWLKDSTTSIDHEYLANENANGKVVKVKKQGDYYWKESKAPAGYQLNPNPVRFTIDGSETDTVSSTVSDDPLPTGSLTVKKKVAGENIPTADQNKEYTFTVNLTLQSGVKWSSYSSGVSTSVSPTPTGGDTVPSITSNVDTPLVYTIKLKHNQTATISGLPQGTTYQVTETSTLGAGWTTTYKINSAEDATTGTSTPATGCTITGSGAVVEFTNTYEQQIETGVILTKTAKEKVGTTDIGDTLAGAKFKLVNADDTATEIKLKKTATDPDGAVAGRKTHEYVVDNGGTYNIGTSYPETGEDGRLHIKGLPVGSYYLEEQEAPDGYSHIDSNTGTNRKVYFSVGDNTVEKEISCTDEMDAAYIRLFEHISEKKAAWGDPTFIFKITNTDTGKTNLVSLTVNDDGTIADYDNHRVLKWVDDQGDDHFFTTDPINNTLYGDWLVEATSETEYKGMYHIDNQGRIKVEPGTYSITRVPVSRYEFVTSGNLVYTTDTEPTGTYTVNSSGTETAETVTLTAGQTGDIHYYDKVGYYDKFSQVDTEVNKFYKLENGANKTIKGIRIVDYHSTATSGEIALTGSALTIYAIYADGTEGELNSTEKAKITFSYTNVDDKPAPFTPDISSDSKTLTVSDVTTYTGNVYTITATYPYDSNTNFTAKFDLVFSRT